MPKKPTAKPAQDQTLVSLPSKPKKASLGWLDGLILLVIAGAMYYTATATAAALQADTAAPALHTSPTLEPLPTLQAAREHSRLGPVISVDQETIGKPNPFSE